MFPKSTGSKKNFWGSSCESRVSYKWLTRWELPKDWQYYQEKELAFYYPPGYQVKRTGQAKWEKSMKKFNERLDKLRGVKTIRKYRLRKKGIFSDAIMDIDILQLRERKSPSQYYKEKNNSNFLGNLLFSLWLGGEEKFKMVRISGQPALSKTSKIGKKKVLYSKNVQLVLNNGRLYDFSVNLENKKEYREDVQIFNHVIQTIEIPPKKSRQVVAPAPPARKNSSKDAVKSEQKKKSISPLTAMEREELNTLATKSFQLFCKEITTTQVKAKKNQKRYIELMKHLIKAPSGSHQGMEIQKIEGSFGREASLSVYWNQGKDKAAAGKFFMIVLSSFK